MWQEVVHRLNANLIGGQEVKIKKTELYSHALIQDILIWAIMSPHAAAAEARDQAENGVGAGEGKRGCGGKEGGGGAEGGVSAAPARGDADDRPKNLRTSMS